MTILTPMARHSGTLALTCPRIIRTTQATDATRYHARLLSSRDTLAVGIVFTSCRDFSIYSFSPRRSASSSFFAAHHGRNTTLRSAQGGRQNPALARLSFSGIICASMRHSLAVLLAIRLRRRKQNVVLSWLVEASAVNDVCAPIGSRHAHMLCLQDISSPMYSKYRRYGVSLVFNRFFTPSLRTVTS